MCKLYEKWRHLKEKKRTKLITVAIFFLPWLHKGVCEWSLSDSASSRPKPGQILLGSAAPFGKPQLSFQLWFQPCWGEGSGPFLVSFQRSSSDLSWFTLAGIEQGWDTWHPIKRSQRSLKETSPPFEVIWLSPEQSNNFRKYFDYWAKRNPFFIFFPCPPTLFAFLFPLFDFSGKFFSKGIL